MFPLTLDVIPVDTQHHRHSDRMGPNPIVYFLHLMQKTMLVFGIPFFAPEETARATALLRDSKV
jgi:hypothetical protein